MEMASGVLERGLRDLDRILADVKTDVKMQVVRNDEGSPSSGSSAVAAMVGLGLGMVLYMFLMIYGAMAVVILVRPYGLFGRA